MARGGMAAFSSRRYRSGPHSLAELYYRDEAVAAGSIPLFRSRPGVGRERSQRYPLGVSAADGNARSGVVEWLDNVSGKALESVDFAPRNLPRAKVGDEFVGCRCERLQ